MVCDILYYSYCNHFWPIALLTYTGFVISIEPHNMWTITSIAVTSMNKAEMRTPSIILSTRTGSINRLPTGMQNLYIKRLTERPLYHKNISPIPFICSDNAICAPVCPIHVILKQGNSKRMRQHLVVAHHVVIVRTIIFCRVDRIRASVDPENPASVVI